MIDYTAMVDRSEAKPDQPVRYMLNELLPDAGGVARVYTYAGEDSLDYPTNQNPLLSSAVALEIRRKTVAMKIGLG